MQLRELQILDTTLRDGSYVIDFQFTAEDTALIVSALEASGIRLIEIGHGLGLGAARAGKGDQASTDEAYIASAAAVLKRASFGTFFIPGIGHEDDIRMAAGHGMGFVRIGTDVTRLEEAEAFAALGKKLGLTVFCNLMKSYAVSPGEFGTRARQAESLGADVLCLVDSAGGMLPEDVRAYLAAAQESCDLPLGFHGHNNLSMAVANSLSAYDSGAVILDASLQGMGRSEGNAITEILAAIFQKRGLLDDIDVNGLLDASEAFIRPLLHHAGYSGLGITSGRAKFHSSFLGVVLSVAQEFGVDPRELILRLATRDKIEAPRALTESLAAELAREVPKAPLRFAIGGSEDKHPQGGLLERVRERALELKEKARKSAVSAVFNIVVSEYEETHVSPYVEAGFGCALSNAMLHDAERLGEILAVLDGIVDYVLLDPGPSPYEYAALESAQPLVYSDRQMWARSTVSHVAQLLNGSVHAKRIALAGADPLVRRAAALLAGEGAQVVLEHGGAIPFEGESAIQRTSFTEGVRAAHAVVALSPRRPCIALELVESMSEGALLYDGGIGSIEPEAARRAEARGLPVVRVDMRPTLSATALELIHLRKIVEDHMGRETWDSVPVVAGGLIGAEGDIIVDSIRHAARVIGIADGRGGILDADTSDARVRKVRKVIAKRQLGAR